MRIGLAALVIGCSGGAPDDHSGTPDSTTTTTDSRPTTTTTTTTDSETGSSDTGTPSTGPIDGLLFEEDFETTDRDTIPAGYRNFVGWQVDNSNNDLSKDVFAVVDTDRVHRGSRALHVRGGGQPAQITKELPGGLDRLYVRFWMWTTEKLGAAPGRNHEHVIALRASSGNASNEVRFGEIKGVIGTNEVPSDDISPKADQWGTGPEISAGQWHCMEVSFDARNDPHVLRASRDGEEVHAITDTSQWNNRTAPSTFLQGKFGELVVGWHSFSNLVNEVWFDDLVVATEPVTCP